VYSATRRRDCRQFAIKQVEVAEGEEGRGSGHDWLLGRWVRDAGCGLLSACGAV
jgi:hypothetical protein